VLYFASAAQPQLRKRMNGSPAELARALGKCAMPDLSVSGDMTINSNVIGRIDKHHMRAVVFPWDSKAKAEVASPQWIW
jgi:hypothetical protein